MAEPLPDSLRRRYRADPSAADELIRELDAALERDPEDVALWCLRGDLVQAEHQTVLDLSEARVSYERALELDPGLALAHQELGYYLDEVEDDPEAAEPSFRAAIACGGGLSSHLGLARVLAQLGATMDALQVLEESPEPYGERVSELRDEILAGDWSPEE